MTEHTESTTSTAIYCWGSLRVTVGQEIKSRELKSSRKVVQHSIDENDLKSHYIVGCLGRGSTSNVFHALDSQGNQVALKVYVKNIRYFDKSVTPQDEFLVQAQSKTEKEVKNLKALYHGLENHVGTIKIFGKWCVKMPFFEPIAKTDRIKKLVTIKDVLNEKFKKNGKKHKEWGIRWRHIGMY